MVPPTWPSPLGLERKKKDATCQIQLKLPGTPPKNEIDNICFAFDKIRICGGSKQSNLLKFM
uniref:Uncharacterized protein n=1 Tax=Physcomitrium patens TaxID=3218 RepID=A0A2K1ITY8_PHYPA|nr:hypothetical protein PHYPA_024686 [Physcomitrium patens]